MRHHACWSGIAKARKHPTACFFIAEIQELNYAKLEKVRVTLGNTTSAPQAVKLENAAHDVDVCPVYCLWMPSLSRYIVITRLQEK